jgi:hypothetical protein
MHRNILLYTYKEIYFPSLIEKQIQNLMSLEVKIKFSVHFHSSQYTCIVHIILIQIQYLQERAVLFLKILLLQGYLFTYFYACLNVCWEFRLAELIVKMELYGAQ